MWVLLIILTVALASLVSDPAKAQTAADDQYGSSGVGHDAATDALRASGAFGDAPDNEAADVDEGATSTAEAADVEEGAAFAAEIGSASSSPEAASADESREAEAADSEGGSGSEEGPEIDSLPDTGGTLPLLLGVLLVASGVLSLRALTR